MQRHAQPGVKQAALVPVRWLPAICRRRPSHHARAEAAGASAAPRHDWRTGLAAAAAAALLLSASTAPASAGVSLQGQAKVVDGDTLEVAGTRVRLFGIDAPESKQSCGRDAGPYACGEASTAALAAKIGGAPVLCDVKSRDLYGRSVAVCSVVPRGGRAEDLCAWQVQQGNAVSYRQYSKAYVQQEEEARAARRGIWAGPFQEPAQWRLEHPRTRRGTGAAGAAPVPIAPTPVAAAPSSSSSASSSGSSSEQKVPPSPGCAIKGNVTARRERIYHVPGGQFYESTRIDTAAGERWFCSEREAEGAGWRRSKS